MKDIINIFEQKDWDSLVLTTEDLNNFTNTYINNIEEAYEDGIDKELLLLTAALSTLDEYGLATSSINYDTHYRNNNNFEKQLFCEIAKILAMSIMLGCPEMQQILTKMMLKAAEWSKEDIKKAIKFISMNYNFNDAIKYKNDIADVITNYEAKFGKKATKKINPADIKVDKTGDNDYFIIEVTDKKHPEGKRYFEKYGEGAALTRPGAFTIWDIDHSKDLLYFETEQQAKDFIEKFVENVIEHYNNHIKVDKYIFTITNKFKAREGKDWEELKKQDTLFGPALVWGANIVKENLLTEKIVKIGSKWQVQSEKGRNMGTYDTKAEAEKRLKQVEYFKHINEEKEEWSFLEHCAAQDIDFKIEKGKLIFKDFKNLIKCVQLCFDLGINFSQDGKTLRINKKYLSENLNEDVDIEEDIEKHETLNPVLFEGNKLKPEVRERLIKIANTFIEGLAEDGIKFNLKDIVFIGSNASYNYTKDSDIDLHLVADVDSLKCPDNLYPLLYGAYRALFNKKFDIDFYGIKVELYVEPEGAPTVSNGIYSVLKDNWIKEPTQVDIPEINMEEFNKEFQPWEDRYNELIARINAAKTTEEYKTLGDEIERLITDIYEQRRMGIAVSEYSNQNLLFKEFRNRGYLDNLKELKCDLKAKELSLPDKKPENDFIDREWLGEYLNDDQRYEVSQDLTQAADGNKPMIWPNDRFEIDNIPTNRAEPINKKIHKLDYVEDALVDGEPGWTAKKEKHPSKQHIIVGKINPNKVD